MAVWENILPNEVRLLRPYLPDGTPITTSMEEEHLRMEEQRLRMEAEARAEEETERRQALEAELERLRSQFGHR